MINIKKRAEAAAWLNGRRDFDRGLQILQGTGFRPSAVNRLARSGRGAAEAQSRVTHLMREYLSVCVSGNERESCENEMADILQKDPPTRAAETLTLPLVEAARKLERDAKAYPERISTMIRHFARAYRKRAALHRQLGALPEDNGETTVAERKRLVREIESLSNYMDDIYPLYEQYLKDGQDCERLVTPVEQVRPAEEPAACAHGADGSDVTTMDRAQLRRLRKSVATKIARARNMLEYQKETKGTEPNPLPAGVKRLKYESRIERLGEWLHQIDVAIARLG